MTEFVDRDGVKLAYETAGRGTPAIVFIHGWACNRSYFRPQVQHFTSRRAVVAVDLRGHGDSDRPEPGPGVYDIDTLGDDVLTVIQATRCEPPVVVGHSLGGQVALACAARAAAVRAAVMVDHSPLVNDDAKALLAQASKTVQGDDDGSWRTEFVNQMFLPTDTVRRDEIISDMTQLPSAIAAATLRAVAQFDGSSALRAVRVPLLSIGSAVPTDEPTDLRCLPDDHDRPDGRRGTLQPIRGTGPGQPHAAGASSLLGWAWPGSG
jgi:pimeloyl-ACP methyl ester carboxylesterase